SGAEPEYYDFIGEEQLHPIVNVVPDDAQIVDTLEKLVLSPAEELKARSREGRKFVERHNAARIVAARFVSAWNAAKK
ncbi:MAG: glycosyltransferase family 1 protein, partial [Muribaculaceae bacterium]|nr:glycosyltransferase family 1 protein [Muribaculaceae bacterium]